SKRKAEAAADSVTVDCRNNRFVHLERAGVGIRPRAGARSSHFSLCEREVLLQITAGTESVAAASENDAPDVVIGFGFLPRLVESPIKVTADGIFFLRPVEPDDRNMG